jgi:hypothetical protein
MTEELCQELLTPPLSRTKEEPRALWFLSLSLRVMALVVWVVCPMIGVGMVAKGGTPKKRAVSVAEVGAPKRRVESAVEVDVGPPKTKSLVGVVFWPPTTVIASVSDEKRLWFWFL